MTASQVYAVASGKGGVGKTTSAVNLAAGFVEAGRSVVLLDADLGMANLADVLDVPDDAGTIHDLLTGASLEDCLVTAPGGFDVVVGSDDIAAFGEADPAGLRELVGDLREQYDIVLLDTGGGLSHGTAVPLGLADAIVLVTTANEPAIDNTEKTVALIDRLDAEIEGVVATRIGGSAADPAVDVSTSLSTRLLGSVPEDSAVPQSAADGTPVVVRDPDSPAGQAYREVAYTLLDEPLPMDWSEQDRAGGGLGAGMASVGGEATTETSTEPEPGDATAAGGDPTTEDAERDATTEDAERDATTEDAERDATTEDAERDASIEDAESDADDDEEDTGPGLASAIETAENDPDAGSPLPGAAGVEGTGAGGEPSSDSAPAPTPSETDDESAADTDESVDTDADAPTADPSTESDGSAGDVTASTDTGGDAMASTGTESDAMASTDTESDAMASDATDDESSADEDGRSLLSRITGGLFG